MESEAELVIIDSLSHLFAGKIEDSTAALKFFKTKFNPMLKELDKTVIVVHHIVKGNEKPIDQNNVAGSRVVLQEFQYAVGFGHLPKGGTNKYCCMLFNKYIPVDDSLAVLYNIDGNKWVQNLGRANKFDLFEGKKVDLRRNESNKVKLLNYFKNQYNLGNKAIKTAELKAEFVKSKIMSSDTYHSWLNKLIRDNIIKRESHGEYKLVELPKSTGIIQLT